MTPKKPRRIALLVAATTLVLAVACSDSDDDSSSGTTASEASGSTEERVTSTTEDDSGSGSARATTSTTSGGPGPTCDQATFQAMLSEGETVTMFSCAQGYAVVFYSTPDFDATARYRADGDEWVTDDDCDDFPENLQDDCETN